MAIGSGAKFHNFWGQFANPASLPTHLSIEAGDTAFSLSDTSTYQCTSIGPVVWGAMGGADPNAIHANVAAEISAVANKAAPTTSDFLLIEDAAAADVKKSINLGSLPGGVDPTALHDNVAAEISAIALKAVPTTSDILVIEDVAAANVKKHITISTLPTGVAPNAIHDNVAGEIAAIAAKAVPITTDLILIEDSAVANAKKSIQIGDLPGGAGGGAGSYKELTVNYSYTQLVAPVEEVMGLGVLDGSLVGASSAYFSAIIDQTLTVAGSVDVKLWELGPKAGPPIAPRLVATISSAVTGGPQSLEQALGVNVAPGANQIHDSARIYQVTVEQNSQLNDTVYVGSAGLEVR